MPRLICRRNCANSTCAPPLSNSMTLWRGPHGNAWLRAYYWKNSRNANWLITPERNLQRLLAQARLGRFRPMADFDWHWPKKIDRRLIERALSLEFITTQRNLILLGANGLGKTMIAKNIAFAAVQTGHRVLFRTASEILTDLSCDSPQLRRRKFSSYARPALLVIDEVGYLSYDAAAADL
jgi:DNA replication protein DnaC